MPTYSPECLAVLELLKTRKNVLMVGAPACGKTTLLSEVADAFVNGLVSISAPTRPTNVPGGPVTIPRVVPVATGSTPIPELPSPTKTNRKVVRTTFNANSKPRDFLSGLVPTVGNGTSTVGFKVTIGKLIQANLFASLPDGTALLVIDELNRGPAVQLFGDAIVALEADKRLNDDGSVHAKAWPFDVLDQVTGEMVPMHLSSHLYVLAAMNQADVSVEPLDVAFIRRWERFSLEPSANKIRVMLGASGPTADLPKVPASPGHVVEAAIRAWESVNERIGTGRGPEFKLGHGVFLSRMTSPPPSISEAKKTAVACWTSIMAHLDEAFFGDAFGIAATLQADLSSNHYSLESVPFGQEQRQILKRPVKLDGDNIYDILLWVCAK